MMLIERRKVLLLLSKTWYGSLTSMIHSFLMSVQAGAGNVIGSSFSELADIIREVEDKSRVGVCLDTCE